MTTLYHITEVMNYIEAMRSQEERSKRSHNYFKKSHPVNENSRKAMVDWCTQIADTLSFNRETVSISISYVDRYFSSGNGRSSSVLENKHEFQLACIAAFYTAVKLHEPVRMDVELVVKLCRGFYTEEEIISMEQDILFSLEWRVAGPSPLDFSRHLLQLLPESVDAGFSEHILKNAEKHMEHATTDIIFSGYKPSVVGVGCILSALHDTNILTKKEETHLRAQMTKALDYDIGCVEILEVQQHMTSHTSSCEPVFIVKSEKLSRSNSGVSTYTSQNGSSSPVCVSQAAD